LALPPDTPNDAFLREVDENLRRDQLRDFAKTYGKWLVLAVVLFLAAVGGWIYWQNRQAQKAAEQSEELHRIFGDVAAGNAETAPQRLEPLEEADSDAVRATALLAGAAVALEANDRAKAIGKYREIVNDGGLPQAYRNAATIRLTALEFDTMKPEDVIERLQPMAQAGNPWFGSAGELTALAYLKQGQQQKAGQMFAAIAADQQVPDSIRSRAVQIAGTLGVDASASLPAFAQQD
jgi:hypothetical protein